MIELLQLVRKPHITEKTTRLKDAEGTICFRVDPHATKVDIRSAVERIFGVKVADVRVLKVHGKMKRSRGFSGYRPNWRKAYVKLKAGEKMIDYFEGM